MKPPRLHRTRRRRQVLFMNLGPASLVVAISMRIVGFETRYVTWSWSDPALQQKAHKLGICPIDIEGASHLPDYLTALSPGVIAIKREDDRLGGDRMCSLLATLSNFPNDIAVALRRQISAQRYSGLVAAAQVNLWRFACRDTSFILFTTSHWEWLACSRPGDRSGGTLLSKIDRTLRKVAGHRPRRSPSPPLSSGPDETEDTYAGAQVSREGSRIVYLPHRGISYGNLFRWDQFFSSDPESPLCPSNMIALTYTPGSTGGLMPEVALIHGPSWKRLKQYLSLAVRGLLAARSTKDLSLALQLARDCERILDYTRQIKSPASSAQVAVLAYDMLVPPPVAIALLAAEIRSIATQERPAAAYLPWLPIILDTFLTAGPCFRNSLMEKPTTFLRQSQDVGMWRTDLIHDARQLPCPKILAAAKDAGKSIVLALPFHAEPDQYSSMASIATSWATAKCFLRDVVALSRVKPECFFVIRGKDANWWNMESFQEEVDAIKLAPNLWMDLDYESLNRSYLVLGHSSAVIARHTSLVDEALALDIPAVLHDYSHNMQVMYQRAFSYLPERLWAHNYEELLEGLDFALEGDGERFRTWWRPFRSEIFGDLNNGSVRVRSKAAALGLLRHSGM